MRGIRACGCGSLNAKPERDCIIDRRVGAYGEVGVVRCDIRPRTGTTGSRPLSSDLITAVRGRTDRPAVAAISELADLAGEILRKLTSVDDHAYFPPIDVFS